MKNKSVKNQFKIKAPLTKTTKKMLEKIISNAYLEPKNSEVGIGKIPLVLILLAAGLAIHAACKIFPIYYYYYDLQSAMQSQADAAQIKSEAEIFEFVRKKIEENGIPVVTPEDSIKIVYGPGRIYIDVEYEEVYSIDLGKDRVYDIYKFNFHPHAEAPLD